MSYLIHLPRFACVTYVFDVDAWIEERKREHSFVAHNDNFVFNKIMNV